MARNTLLSIYLMSVVIVQISWSMPTTTTTTSTTNKNETNLNLLKKKDLCLQHYKYLDLEPSLTDTDLTASNQLLKFTLKSFQDLSLNYARKAKNISDYLLKDPDVLNGQTPKLLEFKRNMTQFQEHYTICDDLAELFDLVELYSNTSSFYYDLTETTLDDDTKLILNLLRKYGSEDLDNEFEKYFNVFVTHFDKKLESLIPELKQEQGHVGKAVLAWYETFKTLNDYDAKIKAFEKYFTFYEDKKSNSLDS